MMTLENLSMQMVELKLTLEGLERERDFYFQKLTCIEDIVMGSNNKMFTAIQDILYKPEVITWVVMKDKSRILSIEPPCCKNDMFLFQESEWRLTVIIW